MKRGKSAKRALARAADSREDRFVCISREMPTNLIILFCSVNFIIVFSQFCGSRTPVQPRSLVSRCFIRFNDFLLLGREHASTPRVGWRLLAC